jgi:hypothetical protein
MAGSLSFLALTMGERVPVVSRNSQKRRARNHNARRFRQRLVSAGI